MNPIRRLFKEGYLSIQAKLVFPLAATIILLVAILSPLTQRILSGRIEGEADRRLGEIAGSVGALIENSEVLARNNAALLATQPEVTRAILGGPSNGALTALRDDLGLQELSLYAADFEPGDAALFYGGPTVARRLQVSEEALRIRETVVRAALDQGGPVSGVAISPQSSQILGAAPVSDPQSGAAAGVVLTVFYLDQEFIGNIRRILDTDIAVVRDNLTIVSTIDEAAGYERMINAGWLESSDFPSMNVQYGDGSGYRLLAHPLVISGREQGTVLVAQPVDELLGLGRGIQVILFSVTGVFALTALWFWIAAFLAFTRPLAQLTEATTHISRGDFKQQVRISFLIFKDEITLLSENFNKMIDHLNQLYTSLEERVAVRTRELAQARDEAVAANRSKSEFVSLVSHELKLPMTSIKGYSDLMLAGASGELNGTQKGFLTTIRNNVNRMATLVSDLADISRIESGNLRIEARPVPVWDVIDEVATLARTQIEEKGQTLTVSVTDDLPKAWCDRNRLSQILINLVSNANKYTPQGGAIEITASQDADGIHVIVRDNGLGMSTEDQGKLFSNFFRSADEKVRAEAGTGLGLSITKNLVELQGGRIWFESALRRGTTFHFTLPVKPI